MVSEDNVTAEEAKELMDNGYTYLDVRTADEYAQGHPAGAACVPAFFKQPGGMTPNPDFVSIVKQHFPQDTPLVVGCLAGGRSAKAVEMLQQAGYNSVVNACGGWGGGRHPETGVPVDGWSEAGLPIETGGVPLS